jgi:hypothetical protein
MAKCVEELSAAKNISHESDVNGTGVGGGSGIRNISFNSIAEHIDEFMETSTVSETNRKELFEPRNVGLCDREC